MMMKTLLAIALTMWAAQRAAAADTAEAFRSDILPILETYCAKCHGPETQEAKINLSGERSLEQLTADSHLWFRALDQLEFGQMPPEGERQPTANERRAVTDWINGSLSDSLAAKQRSEGRSGFRRLSRREFLNTFNDLFGYEPDPSLLPQDGRMDGYAKSAKALPMTTDGAYGYYRIAQDLVDKWVLTPLPKPDDPRANLVQRMRARDSGQSPGHTLELPDGWWVSFNSDDTSGRVEGQAPRTPGLYKVRIHVYGHQTNKSMPIGIYAGMTHSYPQQIRLCDILMAPPGKPAVLETELFLTPHDGMGLRAIPLDIGVQVPKNQQASNCAGPGMALQWLEHEGPALPILADRWLTADLPVEFANDLRTRGWYFRANKGSYNYTKASREEFFGYMQKMLVRVGARLFRRDLTQGELNGLLQTVQKQLDEEVDIKTIFKEPIVSLLTSPEFFCVVESPGELDDFALASRLSYFLWNSTPDDELLGLARAGKLRNSAELRRQTNRLLDDPRSARFVEDFLDQWLDLQAINDTTPDGKVYPEYDDALKFLSLRETRSTFRRILLENRSVREFVAPDSMLVDYRLAEHYGLAGDHQSDETELPQAVGAGYKFGANLQSVPVPKDSPYGGLWTQPAILKVTADGTSTSPVRRGVWMAKRLLGNSISPPPPNIEPINPDTRGATTVREQLALHSSDKTCAHCHKKFDPYGFALESFDVMGQHRERYRVLDPELTSLPFQQRQGKVLWKPGLAVDASGVMPEGDSFDNITELRSILARQPKKLAWGVTWHLLTYATATPTSPLDRKAVQAIVDSAATDDYGLRSIVHGIVQSEVFRWK